MKITREMIKVGAKFEMVTHSKASPYTWQTPWSLTIYNIYTKDGVEYVDTNQGLGGANSGKGQTMEKKIDWFNKYRDWKEAEADSMVLREIILGRWTD